MLRTYRHASCVRHDMKYVVYLNLLFIHVYLHMHVHMHVCIYTYVCMFIYMCVCDGELVLYIDTWSHLLCISFSILLQFIFLSIVKAQVPKKSHKVFSQDFFTLQVLHVERPYLGVSYLTLFALLGILVAVLQILALNFSVRFIIISTSIHFKSRKLNFTNVYKFTHY